MPLLPKITPMETEPIDHFIVKFRDGRVRRIDVGEGEGYFKAERFVGTDAEFTTYSIFVAKGLSREIPAYGNKASKPD